MVRSRRRPTLALPGLLVFVVLALFVVRAGAETAAVESPTTTTAPLSEVTTPPATGLDPGLVDALGRARVIAGRDRVSLGIRSGFRTASEQEALLTEAVAEHGSSEAAERWVFPADRSMHVKGLAIDIDNGRAADWLDEHGAPFGLCRTLDWEWWHFEWRARWEAEGHCPRPVHEPADAPGV